MKTSTNLDKILPGLMVIKSKLQAVTKGANNPFFKSKYADLNTYLDEVEPLLAEQKMILLQPVTVFDSGLNVVSSVIMHESGQFISSEMNVAAQNLDAQKLGAAVTYFRRYTLGALLAMKAEDDDGNAASGKDKSVKTETQVKAKPQVTVSTTTTTNSTLINATTGVVTTEAATKPSFRRPAKPAAPAKSLQVASNNQDDL